MHRSNLPSLRILAAAALVAAGCSGNTAGERPLVVFAAASLTDVLTDLGEAFEREAGVEVEISFAASSALREQILEGAPAAVFASANRATMDRVEAAGATRGGPIVFARNSMQIAVPPGNPAAIGGLDDFSRGELLIGLCAEPVPCGIYARTVLQRAGVTASIDTNEPNVRALLTKIESGELDAGLVYRTDVAASGVDGIEIGGELNVEADYLIAGLTNDEHPSAAGFIDFLGSDEGRRILRTHEFLTP